MSGDNLGNGEPETVTVRLRLFAVVAERAGVREAELRIPVPHGGKLLVAEMRRAVLKRWPQLADLLPVCAFAVNAAYAEDEEAVPDGAEVAVIPPVSGGQEEARARGVARPPALRTTPLDPAELLKAVARPEAGGIVLFIGTVRNEADGHATETLTYEAYDVLAERQLARVLMEVAEATPGVRLAAEHRVGRLAVGEIAVVVAASAPHRAEAFSAAREVIDRIKREVPIWKQETGPDGTRWVEGTPVHAASRAVPEAGAR